MNTDNHPITQFRYTLPFGDYRFRADENGTQYWSDTENHCMLPGCTSAVITTTVQAGLLGRGKIFAAPLPWSWDTASWPNTTIPVPRQDNASGVLVTRTITYTYDSLSRLTAADYSTGEAFEYAYDAVGNRVVYTLTTPLDGTRVTTYTYDAANRLTKVGGVVYTWDARGNLTGDGTFTYTYNAAGRMVRAESLTTTLVYTYTADGLRVAQSVDGVETAFTWDQAAGLAEVLSSDGTTYLHGLDLIAEQRAGAWWYPLGDALGSVRQWTDDSGSVTYAGGYTPFGVELWREGNTTSHWGYTGEWWDGQIRLLYLRARWYAPGVGRFTQLDPYLGNVRLPSSLHHYVYVRNNPVLLTDPSGLSPLIPPFPPDHRDLTDWLVREMQANANSLEASQMLAYNWLAYQVHVARGRVGWLSEDLDRIGMVLEKALFGIAANDWRRLVQDGARWDFKDQIYDRFPGSEDEKKTIMLCHAGGCEWFEYSVPGNVHYGYVGRAAGFSPDTLHFGASVAEIIDPAHRAEVLRLGKWFVNIPLNACLFDFELSGIYVNFEWWRAGFDDPADYAAVELGSELFDTARYSVHRGDFETLLQSYSPRLMHMPAPTEPYFNPAWPYPLGYFDGGEE